MNINKVYSPRPACRGRVIALHCSGAGASQWCHFAEVLSSRYEVLAPEHYGCETRPWAGEHAFTLADEAARVIALIDVSEEKVHLAGHSYGGGVALHVALARPDRIASMALHEPSAFHLLRQMGEPSAEAYTEIVGVAQRFCRGVVTGHFGDAVATFVDFWNGQGTWDTLLPAVQNGLIRWAPKGLLEFRALIDNPTPASVYRGLDFRVLTLRGEHAPVPTHVIAEGLVRLLPMSRLMVVDGAGHMGPLTHAPKVSALIARHIVDAETNRRPLRWRPQSLAEILGAAARPTDAVS